MAVTENGLSKDERLFKKRSIDLLFAQGKSFIAYPFRVVYLFVEGGCLPPALLISVPKRRLKRAVHRNRVKRLVKETYRVRKQALTPVGEKKDRQLMLAFLYVSNEIATFRVVESAMDKTIAILSEKM